MSFHIESLYLFQSEHVSVRLHKNNIIAKKKKEKNVGACSENDTEKPLQAHYHIDYLYPKVRLEQASMLLLHKWPSIM